ncbi:MAG TPA: glycolate oxidase subunit GlcE [Caulobacteraceae bacterium]
MPTSTVSEDLTEALAERVREAAARVAPLKLVGGNTKAFLGRRTEGEILDLSGHRGIIAHEPSELVITARAGAPLNQIEAALAAHGQRLAFEPPAFGPASTLGGVVAAGLSGARRAFAGAVRDCLLGVTILDGRGRRLRFGGVVFKNVAGFDAFRLMAGAMGRLGVLLDVSLRLTPAPRASRSLAFETDWARAQEQLRSLLRRPLPLSGAVHDGERLHLRLEGGETAVAEAADELGGEPSPASLWDDLRHMRLPLLAAPRLWRLAVPQGSVVDGLEGRWLMNWAGAERWLVTEAPVERIRAAARAAGGHATLFRGAGEDEAVYEPLAPGLMALHQRLAAALDPAGVLNPGRMYAGL